MRAFVVPDTPDLPAALARAAASGCTPVEIEALADRPAEHLDALADSGLFVACVRLGRGPGGEPVEQRRAAVERHKRLILDGARLGATLALLTPSDHAVPFVESCAMLASFAAGCGVRLAVRPEAGSAVATVPGALALLPPDVGIALDEGDDVTTAGERIAYVRCALPGEKK